MIEPTFEPAFNAFISHVESFRVLLTGAPWFTLLVAHTYHFTLCIACLGLPCWTAATSC